MSDLTVHLREGDKYTEALDAEVRKRVQLERQLDEARAELAKAKETLRDCYEQADGGLQVEHDCPAVFACSCILVDTMEALGIEPPSAAPAASETDLPPMEPYAVTCARCGKEGDCDTFIAEEGDEWECPPCNARENARERAEAGAGPKPQDDPEFAFNVVRQGNVGAGNGFIPVGQRVIPGRLGHTYWCNSFTQTNRYPCNCGASQRPVEQQSSAEVAAAPEAWPNYGPQPPGYRAGGQLQGPEHCKCSVPEHSPYSADHCYYCGRAILQQKDTLREGE